MRRKIFKFRKRESVKVPAARRLNIGCGRHYHPDWVNLDLESNDPSVIVHDVTKGIPFVDSSFDVVYHSHILEHLTPEQGESLISECYRVLAPGGVLRIVVPDLEQIAQLYLHNHDRAWEGDKTAEMNYRWMKLEMLDQLVREYSGGQMGKYMSRKDIRNREFIQERLGDELLFCGEAEAEDSSQPLAHPKGLGQRLTESTRAFRERMARRMFRWLVGRDAEQALDEGMFRKKGEIHRWMYDRFSLRDLCQTTGFCDFRVCQANESSIEGWASFQLDALGDRIRKPDSLFVETIRQAVAASRAA